MVLGIELVKQLSPNELQALPSGIHLTTYTASHINRIFTDQELRDHTILLTEDTTKAARLGTTIGSADFPREEQDYQ